METVTLIKMLDDIDYKLNHHAYKVKRSFVGTLGKVMELPDKTIHKYNAAETIIMFERKSSIINTLYKRKIISDDEYKNWILSESPNFTPKLEL